MRVCTSDTDVAGLLASSSNMRSILCPLIPPPAFTEATHALYTTGMSWTPAASGLVQAQISPILIGDFAAPLAPAAPGAERLSAPTAAPTVIRPATRLA